jgi:hypothetical protein
MRDMLNNKQVVHLGNVTVSGVTPAASSWVDVKGFDACTLVMVSNTVTDAGTAAGFTATLQEGDDSTAAGATAVAAADAVGGTLTITEVTDGDDNTISGAVGYKGSSRYARLNVVGTTGSDADVSVVAILNKPHRAATTLVGTAVAAT